MNYSLSTGQTQFYVWLHNKMPYLLPLFDFEERIYLEEEVERYFGTASHGETIMARFALGVWRHDDQFNFDFVDAAGVLDAERMKIITDWMTDPFWP